MARLTHSSHRQCAAAAETLCFPRAQPMEASGSVTLLPLSFISIRNAAASIDVSTNEILAACRADFRRAHMSAANPS
jgi:hypothetical protein